MPRVGRHTKTKSPTGALFLAVALLVTGFVTFLYAFNLIRSGAGTGWVLALDGVSLALMLAAGIIVMRVSRKRTA